jgi:hypothetical protein
MRSEHGRGREAQRADRPQPRHWRNRISMRVLHSLDNIYPSHIAVNAVATFISDNRYNDP